ncbi:5-hydroxytryptamine receptor 1D-like [Episyrphus balteatus]|uniref:5-hydroxytryptamine receptor 1D-like n=1 Tax=Episyrphus balteatus TaxID=286459 RepID=UPI0024867723|nr:5-hydroxytryptamine receptor 1D-like [Episyrphus balteatus]
MEEETIVERLEEEINITHPQAFEIQLKLYNLFIPILCSIIILVNLLIVLSSGLILRKRQQPRSTYIFLGNVALSDLLIGTTTLAVQYCPDELRSEMVCCISIGMTVCSTLVSVYSVGLIGIDRYLYILYGLHYQRYVSSQRAHGMVLATWLLAGVISFLPAFGLRNPTDNGKLCWFIVLVPPKLVLFTTSVGMIPLALIIVLYSIILKYALVRISYLHRASIGDQLTQVGGLRLFRGGSSSSKTSVGSLDAPNVIYLQEERQIQAQPRRSIFKCFQKTIKPKSSLPVYSANKWKAIKIVLLTTGAFFVTWVPFFVASMLYAMCGPYSDPDYCDSLRVAIANPLALLGLCNSVLNPIIYAWWHNGFRESVKKIVKGILGERFQTEDLNNVPRISQVTRSTTEVSLVQGTDGTDEFSNVVERNTSIRTQNENSNSI